MLDISIKGVSRLVKVEENPLRRWNLTFMNLDETSVVTHRNKVGRCWYNIDSSLFQFNHDFNVTYFESNQSGLFHLYCEVLLSSLTLPQLCFKASINVSFIVRAHLNTFLNNDYNQVNYFNEQFLPAGINLLKVNNQNTRTVLEICSKFTMKTPERGQWQQ